MPELMRLENKGKMKMKIMMQIKKMMMILRKMTIIRMMKININIAEFIRRKKKMILIKIIN